MQIPVGIDLGTTFSAISCYRNERVEIISDGYGFRTIPSMVYYDPYTGEAFVGRLAYDKSPECLTNLLRDAKRLIGRQYDDVTIKKWNLPSHRLLQLTQTPTGMIAFKVEINGKSVLKTPEEVSAEVLRYLIRYAGVYLGNAVQEAVISIPAYFSGAQRKATLKAAELAGLKVIKLISEPVAGALHYTKDKNIERKLMVIDFGGGTLDVSLIDVKDQIFEVNSVFGDAMLGGRNIDENLFRHFHAVPKTNVDRTVLRNIRRLEQACISMKEYLSECNKISKNLEAYDGNRDLRLKLDLNKFDDLNKDIFQKLMEIVRYSLYDSCWKKEDIQNVILVGGSSRITKVKNLLKDFFGAEKLKTDLNPDEAVAAGAAIQSAILSKGFPSLERYKIREVNPLSLGLSTTGDLMNVIIPRHTQLPAHGSMTCFTVLNDQSSCNFPIIEGERKNTKFNNTLGSFTIEELPKKKAGDVSFTVTFTLDVDGILTVKATENSTGKENSLSVTMGEFRLSEHHINITIEDSKKQKSDDDVFENFIKQHNKMIQWCRRLMYKNENTDCCRKCEDFIEYAENLDYRNVDELIVKYSKLQMDPKILVSTFIGNINIKKEIGKK